MENINNNLILLSTETFQKKYPTYAMAMIPH